MIKSGETCVRGCADIDLINRNIIDLNKNEDSIKNRANLFNLLGNDTRLKIIRIIYNENSACVCDLSDILSYSISAVSQQLKKLKDGGVLINKKDGQTIYYSINPELREQIKNLIDLNILSLVI